MEKNNKKSGESIFDILGIYIVPFIGPFLIIFIIYMLFKTILSKELTTKEKKEMIKICIISLVVIVIVMWIGIGVMMS